MTRIKFSTKRAPLNILITAGPTRESIDAVRFISNRSTGYIGYELAKEAKRRGMRVVLISGPTLLKRPGGVRFIRIETAIELKNAVFKELKKADVLLMASAVSDFRPSKVYRGKLKKKKNLVLKLTRNPDILMSIPAGLRKNRIIVGFSLESKNLVENSLKKLRDKSLDMIVANEITGEYSPFGAGKKTVILMDRFEWRRRLEKVEKDVIACAILDRVIELCYTSMKKISFYTVKR